MLDFGSKILHQSGSFPATLNAKWLHGLPARYMNAIVEATIASGNTHFKDFPGYVFNDPTKTFDTEEKTVFEGPTDATGSASFSPSFNVGTRAPGMLTAQFKTRVFEKGGDFSVDRYTIPYSPYKGYVGVKVPEGKGWNGALYSNEPNVISVVTVNENGDPVNRNALKIQIFSVSWRWWWEHNDDYDLARYVRNTHNNLLKTDYVDTKDGKALYQMNLGGNYYGRKLILITDPATGHTTGQTFYTTYKGWWDNNGGDNPGGAEMLVFNTNKNNIALAKRYR
ncbi:MAG: hypothetical protein HC896_09460 [Bacteroidales bacterium]|nr:hypothetical protein [Bacteroidales bacterium]